MAAKRPPMDLNLDVSALESRTVQQPDPVQTAVEETRKPAIKLAPRKPARPATSIEQEAAEERERQQKSRAGKVAVQTYVAIETRRRLKVLAAQTDVTIEEYLAKAIDELLTTHKA